MLRESVLSLEKMLSFRFFTLKITNIILILYYIPFADLLKETPSQISNSALLVWTVGLFLHFFPLVLILKINVLFYCLYPFARSCKSLVEKE